MSVWMYSTRWPRWIGPLAYGSAAVTRIFDSLIPAPAARWVAGILVEPHAWAANAGGCLTRDLLRQIAATRGYSLAADSLIVRHRVEERSGTRWTNQGLAIKSQPQFCESKIFLCARVDRPIADANMTLCQRTRCPPKWRGQTRSFCSLTIWLVRSDKSFEFWDAAVGEVLREGSFAGDFLDATSTHQTSLVDYVYRRGIAGLQASVLSEGNWSFVGRGEAYIMKGLILAQNERWRRGLGMQVEREPARGTAANGVVRRR